MATRKPDWAQRAVDNLGIPTYMAVRTNYQDVPAEYEPQKMVLVTDLEKQMTCAAALLRAHHRKVKRRVRQVKRRHHPPQAEAIFSHGYVTACNAILASLKEMER